MDSTKIFLLIIGNIINIALSLIFFYLIRILFVVEIVGYYGVILSFLTTFSLITDLGIQLAYLKFYGEAKNSDEEALYNGTFLTFRTFQFAIYTIFVLAFIPIAPTYEGNIFVGYYFFIAMSFFRVEFFQQVFLSKKEVFKNSLCSLIMMLLRNILLILSIFFFEFDIWLLMNIILLSNISHFILSLFLLRKRKFKKPNQELIIRFFKYSFPFFFTNSLLFIVSNIDVLLINTWSSIDNVANYYTAKQFFYYFLIISNSISNVLITTFSKNISNGRVKDNIEIINYTHRFLNLILLPIVFIVYLYAPGFFVLLFGNEYRLTGQILFIFVLLLIPISLDIGNVVQLQALGEIRFIAKFSVLENVLSILFMIFFISPSFLNLDVFGGAISYLIAKIVTQIIYRPIIYKRFNLGFYWGSFRNLVIMFGIFLFQLWVNISFSFPFYFIPLFIIIDIFLYLSINFLLKGFTKTDLKFLLSIINIKTIYSSIVSELKNKD